MKKIYILCFCLILSLNFVQNVNATEVSAKSAIVIEPITKRVLYEKNANEKMSMASTTKLMTALLCLEYIEKNDDEIVTISSEMLAVEGSSMGLRVGDKISLSALIVGMLLPSGNDSAQSCAIYIGKNTQNFASLMNEKAKELGMVNTNFVTASGLDADEHYSTAYDMALLMSECILHEKLVSVMQSESLTVKYYSSEQEKEINASFSNHNKLLSYYDFCDGGKTGYTKKSGRTLVSSAVKDNCHLVAVTLNDPNDWEDHVSMYENTFDSVKQSLFEEKYIQQATVEGEDVSLKLEAVQINNLFENEIKRIIFLPKFLYYQDYKVGEVLGKVCYYVDDKLIYTSEITK